MAKPAPVITPNNDGSVSFAYTPKSNGSHEILVAYNEQNIDGTPFRYLVDAVGGNQFVTAYGPGLICGSSGKENHFTIVGGGSGLAVDIDGPSKTELKKTGRGNAHEFSYTPMTPGEYNISVKTKGKHIHGSPFSAKVSGGEGRKRSQYSLPATSEVSLGGKDVDLTNLVGTIKTPSGNKDPCLLKKMSNGQLGIASFSPKSKGNYEVTATRDGKNIAGSPFKLNIGDGQVASSSKVKLTGAGTSLATANRYNEFEIDIGNAGYGSVSVSIEGAHRCDIKCETKSLTHYKLEYRPHEPGMYLLNIRFADTHVTGSPFMVNVGGDPSGRVRETVTKDIKPAEATEKGSRCEFQLKIPGTDPLDMEALLTSPSGKTELCEIADLDDSLYDIKFKPEELGVHTVSLKHKGLHISGSPFQYTVGPAPSAGPHKVEIGGTGMERGEVGIKNDFNVYTREAGSGALEVAIEGPSKADIDVNDRGHGYTTVSYRVSKQGDYGIHVKYNGVHVPDSPCMVHVIPESGEAKQVTVHGIRDRGMEIDRPVTFNVNLNKVRGELKAYVDVPSGKEEDVFLQELDEDMHAVRFIPKENGIHYVTIKFNEAHIPGSPFPILIGKLSFDPALVLAKGDGLLKGDTGKKSSFTVVTTNAGTGTLNVSIQGPSKVVIQCTEVEEGYEFSYTPMAPGNYMITIKYSNITIAGCPSLAVVTGTAKGKGKASDIQETSSIVVETVEKKPGAVTAKRFTGDASKVKCSGNGLQRSFMNRASTFNIDVNGAGNALLLVGIITATGNPVSELTYKKMKGTLYQVNYKTAEKGNHLINVRWGQDEVPGSPFNMKVA